MLARSSRFLVIFFAALTVVVAVAIGLRVASYSDDGSGAVVPQVAEAGGRSGSTLQMQPDATSAARLEVAPESSGVIEEDGKQTPASMSLDEQQRRRTLDQLLAKASTPVPAVADIPAAAPIAPAPPITMPVRAPQPATPRPVAVKPAPSAPARSVAQQPGSQPSGSTSPSQGSAPTDRDDDPNSDTVPPQIAGVEFVPQQVKDGETTVLTITATDNLSGVRSISGTISSPTGALQGYACQREGETNRFSARVAVPKDAAEGLWNVSYVNLSDNASNSTSVTYAQPNVPQTASFRVTSARPDSNGPTLKAIWLERPSIKAGEKNTILLQADDDKSGVQAVSGLFVSPSKLARIGFNCQLADGLNWKCSFAAPSCLDCGNWQLEQVQMQDKANNMSTLRADNPLVSALHMDIFSDQCDATAPGMQSATLDRNSVRNDTASSITLTVVATDNLCGIGSISGHATGPSQPGSLSRIYFALSPAGDPQTWSGPLNIPARAPKGIWTVTWVQVLDKGYNLKAYGSGEPLLQRTTFRVE